MNSEHKDITDRLKYYDLNFTCYTIYESINYAVYKFKNTHNYFAFSPSFNTKNFYHFKGLTDKDFIFKDIYSSSKAYQETFRDIENMEIDKENLFILAKKFIDFIGRDKSLDVLLEEGKSFKEINNCYKENDIER